MSRINAKGGTKPARKPCRKPLTALAETARYVMLPGLVTPSGGPVLALATGHPRRPVLTALISFASLAALRADGGAA